MACMCSSTAALTAHFRLPSHMLGWGHAVHNTPASTHTLHAAARAHARAALTSANRAPRTRVRQACCTSHTPNTSHTHTHTHTHTRTNECVRSACQVCTHARATHAMQAPPRTNVLAVPLASVVRATLPLQCDFVFRWKSASIVLRCSLRLVRTQRHQNSRIYVCILACMSSPVTE